MKIIICDDNKYFIDIISLAVQSDGFDVVGTAVTVNDAKELIKSLEVDVVLLDIKFTDNGFEGIEILSECKEYTNADIFMTTSVTDPKIMDTCYALGAFYYTEKGILMTYPQIIKITLENRIQQDRLTKRYRDMQKEIILNNLTPKEIEILKLKELGYTHEVISQKVQIEKGSVKKVLSRAYSKIKKNPIGKLMKKYFT